MKAHVITGFGGIDVLKIVDIPKPTIKSGHVLIKVTASSMNPLETRLRSGGPAWAPELPGILHGDVSGTIAEVGEGVTPFKQGDTVYGCVGGVKGVPGALADFVLADERLVARSPQSITLAESAVLPLVSITAWEALIDRAKIQKGQTVLIHAGTGGVGHIAIQLAKWAGATVYTTVSSAEKEDIAKKLGADYVINYKTTSVKEYVQECTSGKGFDVVFDTVGGDNLALSCQAAKTNGVVVTTNSRTTIELTPFHSKGLTIHVVFMLIPLLTSEGREAQGKILTQIGKLVDEGKIRPLIDLKSFTFDEIAQAHKYLESGKAVGKILLRHS